jgi:hypothetical protein
MTAMFQDKYVFAQLTAFLNRTQFNNYVRKYDGDRYVKHFTCWNQLLAIIPNRSLEIWDYLKQVELEDMGRLVNGILDFAERMANRHIPMTMEDWAKRIDIILEASGDAVLQDAGKISAEFAKNFAESEFEKYRVIQDKLFSSDFDKFNSLPFDDIDKV